MTSFDIALAYVFRDEGSTYTHDPADAGGPTKFGVTQRSFSGYLCRYVSPEEIAALTIDKVKPFYNERYWQLLRCGYLKNSVLAVAIFDTGVLYGVETTSWMIQMALTQCGATIIIDRIIGNTCVAALNVVGETKFLKAFCEMIRCRIEVLVDENPKNEKFKTGWIKRGQRLLTLSADPLFQSQK